MEETKRKYLEDLYVFDTLLSTALLVYGSPFFNNAHDVGLLKPCESEIMAGMEAEDVTTALYGLSGKERMRSRGGNGAWRG